MELEKNCLGTSFMTWKACKKRIDARQCRECYRNRKESRKLVIQRGIKGNLIPFIKENIVQSEGMAGVNWWLNGS